MDMAKFIGHVKCPSCGYQFITDPARVVIYLNFDALEQLTTVQCEGCNQLIESKIDFDDVVAFHYNGVKLSNLGDRFEQLTDNMIDNWDIDGELKGVISQS